MTGVYTNVMIIPVRIQNIFIIPESSLCPLLVSLVLFPVQVSGGPSPVLPESWPDFVFVDCTQACEVALVMSDSVTLMDCNLLGSSVHGIL